MEGKGIRLKSMSREAQSTWTLNDRDRDAFVHALLDPPAPSNRMKAAVARYLDARPKLQNEQKAETHSTKGRKLVARS
jgi:hypothetical protein